MSLWAAHARRQTDTQAEKHKVHACNERHHTHITSTQGHTLAISQNNLTPHFTVSLCMKSNTQLWRTLRSKKYGKNRQEDCGTHSSLCHEQETSFTMDTDRRLTLSASELLYYVPFLHMCTTSL